jgi:hypothetical protein
MPRSLPSPLRPAGFRAVGIGQRVVHGHRERAKHSRHSVRGVLILARGGLIA